jgi:hypothetical protein
MNNKYMPLIVAITLPVVFMIVLAFVILVPNMSIKPTHNFVYTTFSEKQIYDAYAYGYGQIQYKNTYDIKNEKIILKPLIFQKPIVNPNTVPQPTFVYEDAPKLYYYDVQAQTSREISFEEASTLTFQKGPSSPDGYIVTRDYSNSTGIFDLVGSNNSTGYVITKGNGKKILSGIVADTQYYGNEVTIIGWIK